MPTRMTEPTPACRATTLAALMLTAMLIAPGHGSAAETRMTLATIPESIPAVRPDGSLAPQQRPGFRVEVLRAAGKSCGANVQFLPVPWQRALDMVRVGTVDGAFSASYSEERAGFAAFPMRNGAPDPSRAMKGYTYNLYLHPDSRLAWDGKALAVPADSGRRVIVERGSAGVELATRLGLEAVPVSGYANMVRMLTERRADGLIAIDAYIDRYLAEHPHLSGSVRELRPPLEARHGYVMFSRAFHVANTKLAECFWKAVGDIRSKPAYRDLVRSYNNGEFVE